MSEHHHTTTLGCCVAAPASNSGKTTIVLALISGLIKRGLKLQTFKCGPDYVDPSFHRTLTGKECPNIDTWLMGPEGVREIWNANMQTADVGICEGVMGLFDGKYPNSLEGSSADCAIALHLPVILVVPAQGMAASVAAIVRGFCTHHPQVTIAGIILNYVGSSNHASILRTALAHYELPPVVGAIPKNNDWALPSRQLGLVPASEISDYKNKLLQISEEIEKYIHFDVLLDILHSHSVNRTIHELSPGNQSSPRGILAVAQDEAFCFYYANNLDYLKKLGWEIVEFSPIRDSHLPFCDALYLGGGYPEQFIEELSSNSSMLTSIRQHALLNKEIYAECGGYMYLCKQLIMPDGTQYPLSGVIDATARMGSQLKSLGYRESTLLSAPLGLPKTCYRGHEFHWSHIEHHSPYQALHQYHDRQGNLCKDGVNTGYIRAGYIHLYWR